MPSNGGDVLQSMVTCTTVHGISHSTAQSSHAAQAEGIYGVPAGPVLASGLQDFHGQRPGLPYARHSQFQLSSVAPPQCTAEPSTKLVDLWGKQISAIARRFPTVGYTGKDPGRF